MRDFQNGGSLKEVDPEQGWVTWYDICKNFGDFYHILRSGESPGTNLCSFSSRHMRQHLQTFSSKSSKFGNKFSSMFFVFRLQIFPGSVFDSFTYRCDLTDSA